MSNDAAEYLAMYPELKKQIVENERDPIYHGYDKMPRGYSGNEVAVALSTGDEDIPPEHISIVGCTFGEHKIQLTFPQFIEHFGYCYIGYSSWMPRISQYVDTIHLKNGKIYNLVWWHDESFDRFVLAYDPNNYEPYDKDMIEEYISSDVMCST